MSPRALLAVGVVVLTTGLLLTMASDPTVAAGSQSRAARGYLADVCVLVGGGLVVVAAIVSSLRARSPVAPAAVDHYRA